MLADAPLGHWLRLLWGIAPPLRHGVDAPFIADGAIHLPAGGHWPQQAAAAAHAAAHLVYSPARFDGSGLGGIARALVALFEDARVEALASRELPGLMRLWRPLHTATPALGSGFEALLRRLARSLADPGYDDPDPWVRKGRNLFYLDIDLKLPALRTPAEVREAAMRLGNDIGQRRLQFNPRSYRPSPAYRDDHRWMWDADAVAETMPPPAVADGSGADEPADDAEAVVTWHPEWDRLIDRLRPDWCRVIEAPVPPAPAKPSADAVRLVAGRLGDSVDALTRPWVERRRSRDGDAFDTDALVGWRVARRLGMAADARVHVGRERHLRRAAVWLLVDQSASTAAAHGDGTVLQAALHAANASAIALQAAGVACAIVGFSSNGRHAVRLRTVKPLETPGDDAMAARLQTLRPGGSTRLGAALRHAAQRLGRHRAAVRWIVVLSDGEPHDVDVHDPRYLVEDARHAVRAARQRGLRVGCLMLAAGDLQSGDARRIFGAAGVAAVHRSRDLPHALRRLV